MKKTLIVLINALLILVLGSCAAAPTTAPTVAPAVPTAAGAAPTTAAAAVPTVAPAAARSISAVNFGIQLIRLRNHRWLPFLIRIWPSRM